MSRRLALIAALSATFAVGALSTTPATAGNVAWSVSIGAPGISVVAGSPTWGALPYYGPYRPYYRPYAPVVYSAPYPYAAPIAYRPVRPYYPRRVVVPYRPVVAVPYGGYGGY